MAKLRALKPKADRSIWRCQSCGHSETKWVGRCPLCQEWSSLVEEIERAAPAQPSAAGVSDGRSPVAITRVEEISAHGRCTTGIGELDRVLGGGMVAGCLVLLGGDPGVGKSTLLVQALAGLARRGGVLYATGEESVAQTAMRARRVGAATDELSVVAETDVERILAHARAHPPAVLAVDSIQTVYTPQLDSIPGSLTQVRECASRLMQFAKTTGTPTIIVGHVTKDGSIAGPKTLEHLVDVVLQLEGDGGPYRILRAHKNRFGSTEEIGVFEMRGAGMAEVENPSAHLLAERPVGAPGSVVVASADGARPLLVEIQALVAPASAGIGRRTAVGVDGNRVSLLLAVLAQRASCDVLDRDVFVNVAGGLRLSEPAIDLGLACAIASSARGRAPDAHTVVFGEVGLAGEVRAVPLCEQRLAEAARLGFRRAVLPAQNAARLETRAGLIEFGPQRSEDRIHPAARVPHAGTRAGLIEFGPQRGEERIHPATRVPHAGARAGTSEFGPQRGEERIHPVARGPHAGARAGASELGPQRGKDRKEPAAREASTGETTRIELVPVDRLVTALAEL